MMQISAAPPPSPRDKALKIASELFYRDGVRAVGMELIVERSGIAKTTIYRHFPTKDALVEAFLEREDAEFWHQWDHVIDAHEGGPLDALFALCDWIGERVSRDNYRGCPQINVAAEYSDVAHPARKVANRHKTEMNERLESLCSQLDAQSAALRSWQIGLLFDGAFMSGSRLRNFGPGDILKNAVERLLGCAKDPVADRIS